MMSCAVLRIRRKGGDVRKWVWSEDGALNFTKCSGAFEAGKIEKPRASNPEEEQIHPYHHHLHFIHYPSSSGLVSPRRPRGVSVLAYASQKSRACTVAKTALLTAAHPTSLYHPKVFCTACSYGCGHCALYTHEIATAVKTDACTARPTRLRLPRSPGRRDTIARTSG